MALETRRGGSSLKQEGKIGGSSYTQVIQIHQRSQVTGWMVEEGEFKGVHVAPLGDRARTEGPLLKLVWVPQAQG